MFYLNYVGCKAKILTNGTKALFSFTLTMWDVKFIVEVTTLSGTQFYLNYVGCKEKCFRKTEAEYSRFYLNYVGCKGSIIK